MEDLLLCPWLLKLVVVIISHVVTKRANRLAKISVVGPSSQQCLSTPGRLRYFG